MKCQMCGTSVPEENAQTVFLPKRKQMTVTRVCGRCFVLVSILDSLRRMERGGSKQLGIQIPNRNES